MKIKQAFLMAALTMVSLIALLYGVSPQWSGRIFLNLPEIDSNIAPILRAIMSLYCFGGFWAVFGIPRILSKSTIITTIIFSGGLVIGRIISLFNEGKPARCLRLCRGMAQTRSLAHRFLFA